MVVFFTMLYLLIICIPLLIIVYQPVMDDTFAILFLLKHCTLQCWIYNILAHCWVFVVAYYPGRDATLAESNDSLPLV